MRETERKQGEERKREPVKGEGGRERWKEGQQRQKVRENRGREGKARASSLALLTGALHLLKVCPPLEDLIQANEINW